MKDLIIKCQNCQQSFVFTQDEQNYYKKNNLENPKHCPICRGLFKKAQKDNFRGLSKLDNKN